MIFYKTMILIRRYLRTYWPDYVKKIISAVAVFAVIIYTTREGAFEDYGSTKSLLFSVTMGAVWTGLSNTLSSFSTERHFILGRIRGREYSIPTHLLSQLVIQAVISLIQAVICTGAMSFLDYTKEGLLTSRIQLDLLIIFFVTIFSATTLGLAVSMVVSNIQSCMAILPLVLIVQMLFSKGIFILKGLADAVSNIVLSRYSLAAVGSVTNILQYLPVPDETEAEMFEHTAKFAAGNLCWILALTAAQIVIAGLLLLYRVKKRE